MGRGWPRLSHAVAAAARRGARARARARPPPAARSASSAGDGGCRSGTMIGVMPAASAARTPGSESSSTTHSPRRMRQARRRREEDVGRGLAVRDLVAADERGEARRRGRCCASFACARGRGGSTWPRPSGCARRRASRAARARPGLIAMPSRATIGVVRARATPASAPSVGIALAVALDDQRLAVAEVAADHQRAAASCRSPRRAFGGVGPRLRRERARCRASGRPCRRSPRAGAARGAGRGSCEALRAALPGSVGAGAFIARSARRAACSPTRASRRGRAAVRVADGAGERIGGVGRRRAGQLQQPPHHLLHLRLGRLAVADHRLLHLAGGVLVHRQAGQHRGRDRRAARLPEQQRGVAD